MNEFVISIGNIKQTVLVSNDSEIFVDGKKYRFELTHLGNSSYILKINEKIYELTAGRINRDQYSVLISGYHFEVTARTALQEKAIKLIEEAGTSARREWEVKAPMPGLILKIKKQKGESIAKGESIMILEAMKMENDLKSHASGIIKNIFVSENTAVEKGTILYSAEGVPSGN